MPCGSRSEYRPRPGVRRRGFRGAVVLRHRAAKHCPAAALRPASVTRLHSVVFGRRDCVAWSVSPGAPVLGGRRGLRAVRVLSGRVAGTAWHGLSAPGRPVLGGCRGCLPCDGALCRCRGPGRPGRGVRSFACASGNSPEAHALCEQGILPLSRKMRAGLLRPARAYATEQGMPSASTRAAMRSSSSRPTFSSVGQGVSRSSE